MGLNPKGRDWGSLVNWDDLGKAYAAFTIAWTVMLCTGMAWLIRYRHLPFIRIRNIPLMVLSTVFLHLYLVKILLAYTTNGHFLCSAEFWIMSIYLPLGISLFQANMVQLRSISDQQQNLVTLRRMPTNHNQKGLLKHVYKLRHKWSSLTMTKKTYILIGFGLVVQLVVTTVLYVSTPTLQEDWKSFGKVTHAKGQALCRKTIVWTPSAFWQLAWSWVFGPYTLFQIRKIHDVHYWRLQIILSVISGLPGTPLWIASLHSTAFKNVNKWVVPPMWLAPGIIIMQFVTIFFPIYEAYRSRAQMKTTLSIIESWDEKRHLASDAQSSPSESEKSSSNSQGTVSTVPSRGNREIRCMVSLEKALNVNPLPLLRFAATKDFTAENIIFLMKLKSWRANWSSAPIVNGSMPEHVRTRLFDMAVDIYGTCVNDRTAEFPINIESHIKTQLDSVFKAALQEDKYTRDSSYQHTDIFDLPQPRASKTFERKVLARENSSDSDTTLWDETNSSRTESQTDVAKTCFDAQPYARSSEDNLVTIPAAFDKDVFKAAEKSIKYLVLTNTWQKFVDTTGDKLQDIISA